MDILACQSALSFSGTASEVHRAIVGTVSACRPCKSRLCAEGKRCCYQKAEGSQRQRFQRHPHKSLSGWCEMLHHAKSGWVPRQVYILPRIWRLRQLRTCRLRGVPMKRTGFCLTDFFLILLS